MPPKQEKCWPDGNSERTKRTFQHFHQTESLVTSTKQNTWNKLERRNYDGNDWWVLVDVDYCDYEQALNQFQRTKYSNCWNNTAKTVPSTDDFSTPPWPTTSAIIKITKSSISSGSTVKHENGAILNH